VRTLTKAHSLDRRLVSAALYVREPASLVDDLPKVGRFDAAVPAEDVLRWLDEHDLSAAVMHATLAHQAFTVLDPPALQDRLQRFNSWALELAARCEGRIKPTLLLDTDDPIAAADEVEAAARAGAGAFEIPLRPHGPRCYQSPAYEPLWSALERAGRPVCFGRGTCRRLEADPRPFDLTLHQTRSWPELSEALADALDGTYARLGLVSMTLAGVFERYPRLRVGTVGFGIAWLPYALARLDEMYEVRPERVGEEETSIEARTLEHHAFAKEGLGFNFDAGEQPSRNLRRGLFVIVRDDDFGLDARHLLPPDQVCWARADTANPFSDLKEEERAWLCRDAARKVYDLGPVESSPPRLEAEAVAPAPKEDDAWLLFSADCHVVEPPDLWIDRIEPRFRDRAPRVARYEDTELWVVDGETRMAVVGIQAQAGRRYVNPASITKRGFYEDIGRFDPDRYVQGLDVDGVRGAVLFSSNAHQCYRCVAGDLLSAIVRAYNDWVLEYASAHPRRLKAVTVLNVDDPREAAAELERTVRNGAAGALIPILPLPDRAYHEPRYEVLWSAASDLNVPLLMHVGGNQAVLGREPVIDLVRHATKDLHVRASVASLALSGVLQRFPALRLGVVEFGASWLPDLMNQVDRVYKSSAAPVRWPGSDLPSDHLKRNLFVTFQDDPAAIRWRDHIGVSNLMWGSDYPHAESTFPQSRKIFGENMRGVPAEERTRMASTNVVEMFGFDVSSA
jgi:predicted TIM-barrel fold metal-dependent hydrolase